MSGRIRTVKPEWLEDELLALASPEARVLSIGLMLLADDHGNGRANPTLLAGQVFPGKPLELAAGALVELRGIRFVSLYEVDGQTYFTIRNWDKHQRVDKRGKNRVPLPSEANARKLDVFSSPVLAREFPPTSQEIPGGIPASCASEVVVQVMVGATGPDLGPGQPGPPAEPRSSDPDSGVQPCAVAAPRTQPDPADAPPPEERDLVAMSEKMLRNRGGFMSAFGDTHTWPEIRAICQAFQDTWGRVDEPRHGGDPRARVILERLAEGIPVERLVLAVQRSKFADYMREKQSNQALMTILRDAAQVDKFCALTALPRKASAGRAPQPEGGNWKAPVENR
jgi:hypothetical protein